MNYLGHFLLTLELLPCLRKVEAGQANVVILSSAAHTAGKLDLSNMNGEDHYSRYTFYANSKMYNVSQTVPQQVTDGAIGTINCTVVTTDEELDHTVCIKGWGTQT